MDRLKLAASLDKAFEMGRDSRPGVGGARSKEFRSRMPSLQQKTNKHRAQVKTYPRNRAQPGGLTKVVLGFVSFCLVNQQRAKAKSAKLPKLVRIISASKSAAGCF